ncbi:MAG TPA: hypothetical protein PLB38_01625 [bacterium]|nr:hypothetical protein [bacterium]
MKKILENFFSPKKTNNSFEAAEKTVLEKLDSLGVNYKYSKNRDGRLIYTFLNVQEAGGGAFYLDAKDKKIVYFSFHHDESKFKHPEDMHEISSDELLDYANKKFSDADEIIYSCCYPDTARKRFQKPVLIIGAGSLEYRTVHNSINNSITCSPVE